MKSGPIIVAFCRDLDTDLLELEHYILVKHCSKYLGRLLCAL